MDFCQPVGGAVPTLTTKETQRLRLNYPSIEHLEAGHAASWLQERHDQLLVKAQRSRTHMNVSKLITLAGTVAGMFCYATSPFAAIGAIASAVGYVWSVGMDLNDSHRFAPLPFIRDNFLEFMQAMGDAEAREEWFQDRNEIADLMFHLDLLERYEFAMLREFSAALSEYLDQVEAGKRFYAYRWLSDRYVDFKGLIPDKDSLNRHLETVTPDPRINYESVQAIQQRQPQQRFVELPQARTIALPQAQTINTTPQQITPALNTATPQITPATPTPQQQTSKHPTPEALIKLPLVQRAEMLTKLLIDSGFKIDEVLASQVTAIAGIQRGGKGTLAAILATMSKAYDSNLTVEYFTSGVDVYPFACNLHSALTYPSLEADAADKAVAVDLIRFLKKLEGTEPYSNQNLILVIDETMRLLSLVSESDRTWAIQFLLSRFAKTGATLIVVLHASNLSSIAGKETAGLADTFKAGVQFVGCTAQSVSAGGLRKMDIASGAYFKANPANFSKALENGELGNIPEWLKTEKHPKNKHPDPARTLLKFFPELVAEGEVITAGDVMASELMQAVQDMKNRTFTVFNVDADGAIKLIKDLEKGGHDENQIIAMLWQVSPDSPQWGQAIAEYELLKTENGS